MGIGRKTLKANIQRVRDAMAAAAANGRRDLADVKLIAVSKTAPVEDVKEALEQGLTELGESRVQQLVARHQELSGWLAKQRLSPCWHMIGHLQRNKVKAVLEVSRIIHSVDTLRLAEEISERCEHAGQPAQVLLEVNCSEEPQKFGVAVGAVTHLGEQISTLPGIRLVGLMTMAPQSNDPERSRRVFVRMREIFEEMRAARMGGKDLRHLSMGMSQDYAVAIEEGATMIRVGRAIFGASAK
jgi:PLP dependent protein